MTTSKMGFIGFIAEVGNYAAQVKRRTEKIDNLFRSPETFGLGGGISSKEINRLFKSGATNSSKEPKQSRDSSME